MSIKIIDKHTAKLIVEVGKGSERHRKTKLVQYSGKRDLEKQYREFEEETKRSPLTSVTVEELLSFYMKSRRTLGIKATTLDGYESDKDRIVKVIGNAKAKDLTPYELQGFVTALSAKYSTKTIQNTMSLLKSAYNEAVRLGLLNDNPCTRVSMPKVVKPEITVFTHDEILKFLSVLRGERLDFEVAYKLALFCGLRRSEILGLREEHINLAFKTVKIADTRHRVKNETIIQGTKTSTSYRTLSVPESLIDDIKRLMQSHHDLPYEHTDYLIQDGFGQPMNPSTLTNRILRIEKKHGLPNVSLHDLRHTFTSILINAQAVDIAQISAELGHGNITTTLDRYSHVFNGIAASSKEIANIIDGKFGTFTAPEQNKRTAEA